MWFVAGVWIGFVVVLEGIGVATGSEIAIAIAAGIVVKAQES